MRNRTIKNLARAFLAPVMLTAMILTTMSCGQEQTPSSAPTSPEGEMRTIPGDKVEEIASNIQDSLRERQAARSKNQTLIARAERTTPTPGEAPGPAPRPTSIPTETPVENPVELPRNTPAPAPTEERTKTPTPEQTQEPTSPPAPAPNNPAPGTRRTETPTQAPREKAVQEIYKLPWIEDGVTDQEEATKKHLIDLGRYNPSLALRLITMPFLKTHQPLDTGAVGALNFLDYNDPETAGSILDHYQAQGGIANEDTPKVAIAYTQYTFGGDPTRILQEDLETESQTVRRPLGEEIQITVARRELRQPQETLDRIENTLVKLEEYLRVKIPTHNVLVHYGGTLPPGARSGNTFISIVQEANQDRADQFHWTIHELVHYWFNSNQGWLDEGMAQTVTSIMKSGPIPPELPIDRGRCPQSARIQTTLTNTEQTDRVASWCVYNLGERFMKTLYNEAGYDEFRKAAGNLAEIGTTPPERSMGVQQVKQAFRDQPEAMEAAMERWYRDPR